MAWNICNEQLTKKRTKIYNSHKIKRGELQEVLLGTSRVSDFEIFFLPCEVQRYLEEERKLLALRARCDSAVSCNSLFRVSNFPAILNRFLQCE